MEKLLKFQKDYWLVNNGKPAIIPPIEEDLDRYRKIKKILDKINGVEHKYVKLEYEKNVKYFYERFNKLSLISNLK
jgi:hypothetical protein